MELEKTLEERIRERIRVRRCGRYGTYIVYQWRTVERFGEDWEIRVSVAHEANLEDRINEFVAGLIYHNEFIDEVV